MCVSRMDNVINYLFIILKRLDGDVRNNLYIGITGLLVAVVVFIAEYISNKKIDIYKSLILQETKIIKNIILMVSILGLIWISQVVPENSKKYILIQIIINIMIIYSSIEILKMFIKAIKLNIDQEFFDDELEGYIYNQSDRSVNKENQRNKAKIERKNKKIEEFLADSEFFELSKNYFNFSKEYKEYKINKKGIIVSFNINKLKRMEKKIQTYKVSRASNLNEVSQNIKKPKIQLCVSIGQEISENSVIAYYKDVSDKIISMLEDAISVDNAHIDANIPKVLDDVFKILYERELDYDKSNFVVKFYEHLCIKNYENIIRIFLEKVYIEDRNNINNIDTNIRYTKLLIMLIEISIKNDRYDDFSTMNSYINAMYIRRIKMEEIDIKRVAYEYANYFFLHIKYQVDDIKNDNNKYYDCIMSGLLVIISELLLKEEFESIYDVLLENIRFERNESEEFSDYDITNFQFVVGIIYFILCICKKTSPTEDFVNKVQRLIKKLKNNFFDLYDIGDTILKFNQFTKINSKVMEIINNSDLNNESHQYKNCWIRDRINLYEALKALIYMFDISYDGEICENKIVKEDIYRYERLLYVFEKDDFIELENRYNYKTKYKEKVGKIIKNAIDIAKHKEKEYKSTAKISKENIEKFKKIILNNSMEIPPIMELLEQNGKVKRSEEKLYQVFGISELLPRHWFIEGINQCPTNAPEEYGKNLQQGIDNEIINSIKKISKKTEKSLKDIVKNINNLEDFVVIANIKKLREVSYNIKEENVEIDGKKISAIPSKMIDEFLLINKQALPSIVWCKFDDRYNKENIEQDTYIEITDCSDNKELRKAIIDNNDWLKEKGDTIEQDNYLKTMCDFKLYKSYKIVESEIKEVYLIEK